MVLSQSVILVFSVPKLCCHAPVGYIFKNLFSSPKSSVCISLIRADVQSAFLNQKHREKQLCQKFTFGLNADSKQQSKQKKPSLAIAAQSFRDFVMVFTHHN